MAGIQRAPTAAQPERECVKINSEERIEPPVSLPDRLLRAFGHLPIVPRGARVRLVNMWRPTDKAPDLRFEVPFFGMKYKGTLACEIDRQVFFFGAYEPEMLVVLGDLLARMDSPIVGDIGANVGHHSLYFSKLAAHVHSFEPWSKVRDRLDGHLHDNSIGNVTVHHVALGAEDETRIYYAPTGGNSGTGSFVSTHAPDRNRPAEPLAIVNGDRYLEQNGIEKLDLVKIDVEGWELFVLKGLAQTIDRCRPVVLFEQSRSTSIHLKDRSQLTMFRDYEIYAVGRRIEKLESSSLPIGNILLVPREKSRLLRG